MLCQWYHKKSARCVPVDKEFSPHVIVVWSFLNQRAPTFVLTKTSSSLPIRMRQTSVAVIGIAMFCHSRKMTVRFSVSSAKKSPQHKTCKCFACSGLSDEVMRLRFFLAPVLTKNGGSSCTGTIRHQRERPPSDGECDFGTHTATRNTATRNLRSDITPNLSASFFGTPERTQGVF